MHGLENKDWGRAGAVLLLGHGWGTVHGLCEVEAWLEPSLNHAQPCLNFALLDYHVANFSCPENLNFPVISVFFPLWKAPIFIFLPAV